MSTESPDWVGDLRKEINAVEAKLNFLIDLIKKEQPSVAPSSPVLTRAEAMRYVKCQSRSAFDRWINQYAKDARCSQGRFRLIGLQRGRDKQARSSFEPKRKRPPVSSATSTNDQHA